jgi:hypothetical protein
VRHSTTGRSFHLRDGLILIAAIAIGFAAARRALRHFASDRYPVLVGPFATRLFYGLLYATPIIIACSTATLLLAGLRRRPLRRLSRQPGFMANAGGLAGVIAVLAPGLIETAVAAGRDPESAAMLFGKRYVLVLSYSSVPYVWCFVLGAVLPSILRGEWRPRPEWLDRLGWLLGSMWCIMATLLWAQQFSY